ncbi:LptA/OstA family protein [Yunchengibacter salinarum]|uniref:LptA/OstA family protein n=1 Tax=Yunchengibacter salinarum TaxID=3133399 RepID=UPI0035B5C8E5
MRSTRHPCLPALAALMMLMAPITAHAQSVLKEHDTYQPLDISAERLEVKQKEGRALFEGAVKVVQGKLTLTADELTVFYENAQESDDPSIRRLDARGDVMLTSTTEKVTADWGVYDVDRRLVTMGGDVQLTRNDSVVRGKRLELDLETGLTKLDGAKGDENRVRGRFSVPDQSGKTDNDGGR